MQKNTLDSPQRRRSDRKAKSASIAPEPGEGARFAHAVARVVRGMSTNQLSKSGNDFVSLIERAISVPALTDITDKEKPTPAELRKVAAQLASRRITETALDRRLGWLAEALGFDHIELAILGFFARWVLFDVWRDLSSKGSGGGVHPDAKIIAVLLDLPIDAVEQRLSPGAPLLATELVHDDRDGEFNCSSLLKRLSRNQAQTPDDLLKLLLPEPESSMLDWDDFEQLGEMRHVAKRLLAAQKPVSILLFGAPGTGKTEFARTAAQRAGPGAIFAGIADDSGREPTRSERLSHLMLLRALCARRGDAVIVVDEADDVLQLGEKKNASKQWINRLVEAPRVPTIWIVNDHDNLDPAVLRRMALAIRFDRPTLPTRQRITLRNAEAQAMHLNESEIQEIAALQASPAVVASGLRVASLAGGGAATAKSAIESVMLTMGQSLNPEIAGSAVYDPRLSCADTDLPRLADRLASSPKRSWSLLLTGPSGTGKSAFARHIAKRAGLEIEERRCSDILSPFLGETERNIAAAFSRAATRGALLLLDEADSLLYRREGAQRNWEVSQVNEMLVQMEHLQAPFIATTNLSLNLDPAAQRRFTMRVGFKPMAEWQARELFRSNFGIGWPSELPVTDGQTPGDFTVVAHRATLLGENDPAVLVRWLIDEIEARGEKIEKRMGFFAR